jgi:DNA mismatch repair protein MutS2
MNYKALQKLEYDKILERLEGFCGSALGREFVPEMTIELTSGAVRAALAETTEARRLIDEKGNVWSFNSIPDVTEAIEKLRGGQILEPSELHAFRLVLEFSGEVKGTKLDPEKFPVISEIRERLFVGTSISRSIASAVDDQGQLKDGASTELARIRRKLRELERSIPDRLRRLVLDSRMDDVVQDRVVTVRNGRFVIPIKSEYLERRSWVLQDRSSSGVTSFVEPLELVEENNRITRERLNEKEEVLRILRALTGALAEHAEEIGQTLDALGELDFLFARARYGIHLNAVEPQIADGDAIVIRGGRHPLLTGDVVPVDIELGGPVKTLLLTGPNAGGKTVTLKLVGLFQIMAQSGLHVPALDGTSLPVLSDVFAIIGDEQSVENNLSTFSSHLKEIKWVLDRARAGSLVLIDEICSGTDPEEGTALSCGILKELMSRGAVCLATSHQNGLKTFASVTPGAENARVVFDERSREPVFRVEIGIPGKSYALEIAGRAGFDSRLISEAREYLSSQTRMTERLLAELDEMKGFLEIEKDSFAREKKRLEREREEQTRILNEAELRKDEALQAAYSEAERIVQETRRRCDEILRGAKYAVKLPEAASIKGEIKEIEKKIEKRKPAPRRKGRPAAPEDLKPDAWFLLRDTGETVQFVSGPDRKGRVQAQLGEFRVSTDARNLLLPDGDIPPERPKPADHNRLIANAKDRAKLEIDLRGMRAVEALATLERELDNLNLAGSAEVRIIHGIGTGALMKAVQEYLPTNPFVRRFEPCPQNEGGSGATKVFLSE